MYYSMMSGDNDFQVHYRILRKCPRTLRGPNYRRDSSRMKVTEPIFVRCGIFPFLRRYRNAYYWTSFSWMKLRCHMLCKNWIWRWNTWFKYGRLYRSIMSRNEEIYEWRSTKPNLLPVNHIRTINSDKLSGERVAWQITTWSNHSIYNISISTLHMIPLLTEISLSSLGLRHG